jgi:hypothetical protein
VRDGYVSAEAGRDLYGVVLTSDGELDAAATEAQRAAIRERRIGHAPERTVRPNAPLFAPLGIVDGRWRCALCEQDLGDEHDNWRAQPSPRDEISERYSSCTRRSAPRCRPSRSSSARTSARAARARWRRRDARGPRSRPGEPAGRQRPVRHGYVIAVS